MSSKATAKPKEIIEEINKLRADPILYSKKVEEYSQYFTDKILKLPNLNVKIRTQEGSAPYLDTIEYLKTKEKKNALVPSKALCEIAQEIADNLIDSETGEIDEELHEQIIDKHGSFNGKFTRAMDFGGFTSEQVVINFLVCDGDEDRTQREPLLGDGLNKIGVAFGKHNIYSTICVLVTCTEFTNTKDPDDIMVFKDIDENEEKKKLEQEKLEKEKLEKERLEQEKLEQERLEKERLEKERLEKEKALQEEKEKEKIEGDKKKEEEEKRRKEEGKKKEEEKKRKEEEEDKKKKEEEKKKKLTKNKFEAVNNNKEEKNIFKLKKKIFAYETVPKDQLPEGVASMTKSDTIVIEGGKRYKKIIYNKVMLDGTKKTEEVKECLDK